MLAQVTFKTDIVYQTPKKEVEEIPVTPHIQNKMDNIDRLL